jgi:hypothetical protein
MDESKEKNVYCNFIDEALDFSVRRTRFGTCYEPVLRPVME